MDPVKAVLVFCATLFFVLSPALSGGFSGYDPALFPVPQEASPAQPAGYAFAIWGLIYAWLMVSAGAGMFTARSTDPAWEVTRLPLFLSLAPGAAWIGIAQGNPVLATVVIFWMLGTALWALARCPDHDIWLLRVPVGLYAGWLSAAAWVSLGVVAPGYGLAPGPVGWALIALIGALGTGLFALTRLTRSPAYAAALIWALIGITVADIATYPLFAAAALLGAGAIAITLWQRRA